MPAPSTSLATLRPDLGASFEEFDLMADRQGFIGHLVLPTIEVQQQSDTFGRIPIEQLLADREVVRNSRSGYARGEWTFTQDSYATTEYGMEEPVDDRDAKIYGNYFTAEQIAAEISLDSVMRARERRIAALLQNTETWTPTPVTNEWDDAPNATPITDVEGQVQAVYDACGLWPNALIISKKVFRNLRNCAQIIDRLKYNGIVDVRPSKITADSLAAVFDLDRVVVAGGTRNTADAGQTATLSTIWSGEYAMVARLATSNNIKEPCLGRTFHWGGDGSSIGGTFETYRDETVRADIARCRHEVHEKILYPECAALLSNITT